MSTQTFSGLKAGAKSSTRVHAAPGGNQSFSLFGGPPERKKKAAPKRTPAPQQQQAPPRQQQPRQQPAPQQTQPRRQAPPQQQRGPSQVRSSTRIHHNPGGASSGIFDNPQYGSQQGRQPPRSSTRLHAPPGGRQQVSLFNNDANAPGTPPAQTRGRRNLRTPGGSASRAKSTGRGLLKSRRKVEVERKQQQRNMQAPKHSTQSGRKNQSQISFGGSSQQPQSRQVGRRTARANESSAAITGANAFSQPAPQQRPKQVRIQQPMQPRMQQPMQQQPMQQPVQQPVPRQAPQQQQLQQQHQSAAAYTRAVHNQRMQSKVFTAAAKPRNTKSSTKRMAPPGGSTSIRFG